MALLTQSDFVYQGAFKLPAGRHGDPVNFDGFSYGGWALAYYAAGNGGAGSLYIVGHNVGQRVAEINIPTVVNSTNLADLNTATVLQDLVDSLEGHKNEIDPGEVNPCKVGGLLVNGTKLIISVYSYYDGESNAIASHFSRPLNLSTTGQVVGPVRVYNSLNPGYVAGYMADIPAAHQAAFNDMPSLTGMFGLSVLGRTSMGPCAVAFDPAEIGVTTPVPGNAACYYNSAHPTLGVYAAQSEYWNGSSRCRGLIFPTGFDSVLFFGNHGTGPWCYGTGAECSDPAIASKGSHAYPYVYQVWHYEAADLEAVVAATASPWDFTPEVWHFNLPFESNQPDHEMGGAAYDATGQRIFWVQMGTATGVLPIVHVFEISGDPPAEEATLTISPATIHAGQSETVTWSGIASPAVDDYIGLFQPSALNQNPSDWFYLNNSKTEPGAPVGAAGNFGFVIPGRLRSGSYEMRLFGGGETNLLATSSAFTVHGKTIRVRT